MDMLLPSLQFFLAILSLHLLDIVTQEDFCEDGTGGVPDAEEEVESGEVGTAPLRAPQPQHADIAA